MIYTITSKLVEGFKGSQMIAFTGWDVILDNQLNPWIMEFNARPDMREQLTKIADMNKQIVTTGLELKLMNQMNQELPKNYYGWRKVKNH